VGQKFLNLLDWDAMFCRDGFHGFHVAQALLAHFLLEAGAYGLDRLRRNAHFTGNFPALALKLVENAHEKTPIGRLSVTG
jgi:hypothetical protein